MHRSMPLIFIRKLTSTRSSKVWVLIAALSDPNTFRFCQALELRSRLPTLLDS